MNPRGYFLRLGPSRWWYVVGLGLWVAGFVGLFGYGYTLQSQRDDAAETLQRAALAEPVVVQVTEAGGYGVWLETTVGGERPETVRRLLDSAQIRLVDVRVTGPDGDPVPVGPTFGNDHRVTTESAQLQGWGVGEMTLTPGEYQITLVDAEAYTGPGVAGLAVGPLPTAADGRVFAGGLLTSVAGLLVCLMTVVLRQRATRRASM
ncbi:hypothetical protein [Solwaraspora sp. WMMA2101]|uniref:hypothetical protein n=1 Tax=Solwaraspora sp. WMMA2101 TaxID=3404124 RepID=UPI003B9308B0